jgi:glyoxylate reductase
MSKQKVLVTRKLPGSAIKKLQAQYAVTLNNKSSNLKRSELKKMVVGQDAILCLLADKIDKEIIDAAGKQLKVIANYAVGCDNIDIATARAKGIIVTNTPGVLTQAVAEHAMALLITIARRIPESDKFLRQNKYKGWEPELFLGNELCGKTLGIVGMGRIGGAVAKIAAKGYNMKVVYFDNGKSNPELDKTISSSNVNLTELLKTSDFVSIHVPLLPSTRHLIGKKELGLMKKTAYLVNTARGPIIDEKALVNALKNKKIAGAALDVFEFEPKLSPGMSSLTNIVITPHIASATIETRTAMAELAVNNIIAVLSGQPAITKVE